MKLSTVACVLMLCAQNAPALTLDPRGTGQVLLFPYYTVNRQQQTLLSVSNLSAAAKVARVRFREAYDGREVLDFDVFLAPQSTWTGVLFALADAGLSGDGAAIALDDTLCTHPAFSGSNALPDGRPYQPFLDYAYVGANADSGPVDGMRTREGYFEVVEMAELSGGTRDAITPLNGIAPGCATVAGGNLPAADLLPPGGGLSGSAAIVDVPLGTFYATGAAALDGVYNESVYTSADFSRPDLRDASAAANGLVSAYLPLHGSIITLSYPPAQAVDAASAVLTASEIVTDYDVSAGAGAQTDWVITFPTKHFYVDPRLVTNGQPVAPFGEVFGAITPGRSDVPIGLGIYNRSGSNLLGANDITPPPPHPPPSPLPYESQVVMFAPFNQPQPPVSPALGAAHPLSIGVNDSYRVGVTHINLAVSARSRASQEGVQLRGLPAIGFEAINYVNANATPGVLANYSAALPLRALAPCLAGNAAPADAPCP